jgi:CO/xanthine dehydrogenase FAD-binding subunit
MKPGTFAYHCPHSEDEALALLAESGDAKVLAGGQSLVPAMNFRLARPTVLVDLNRIATLSYIKEEPSGGLRIGAMTRQRAVERSPIVAARAPLLAEAMPWIAHAQIRNRGTVGGSLAHADPAAELPAVMVALGAQFTVRSRTGARGVPADRFYTGLFTTALQPGEVLVSIEIPPRQRGAGSAFTEVARRHGDFALAGVATEVVLDASGQCTSSRIVLLSVGDGPVVASKASSVLTGRIPNEKMIDEAARIAGESDVDPPSDIHASAAYRRQLVRVLVSRALTTAVGRARV